MTVYTGTKTVQSFIWMRDSHTSGSPLPAWVTLPVGLQIVLPTPLQVLWLITQARPIQPAPMSHIWGSIIYPWWDRTLVTPLTARQSSGRHYSWVGRSLKQDSTGQG